MLMLWVPQSSLDPHLGVHHPPLHRLPPRLYRLYHLYHHHHHLACTLGDDWFGVCVDVDVDIDSLQT